ncbi:hypothetical protein ABL78_7057 [Leptomonas seymouri]|uniref:Uncharacterized protein n=1 Tax=Leptomonas seymouri TaxID=5684 RepID=A0A0N0P3P3_LEPSE|nr:hypothetical protein ABL78_7057 [Leptomonas seymouri]|eukprot:KPI83897.1 hypothetical protein ABL78_7057 [Leptomonas seymouri]
MDETWCKSSPSSPVSVRVEVKGSLDIPLRLGLLSGLGDSMLEQEIVEEAVRIAVSEKLGYFDGIDVRFSPNGDLESVSPKTNGQQRHCEASVDLQRLGDCIVAIQKAYDGILAQVRVMQEVLSGTGDFASPMQVAVSTEVEEPQQHSACGSASSASPISFNVPNEACHVSPSSSRASPDGLASARYADALHRLSTARLIVEQLLQGRHPDVVCEAAVLHEGHRMHQEVDMLAPEHSRSNNHNGAVNTNTNTSLHGALHVDYEDGEGEELRRGLLAGDDEGVAPYRDQGDVGADELYDDDLDEEALHDRYLKAGYSPL